MKIIRFSGYFVIALIIFFGPLYGAGRIILPDWIRGQIASMLPSGTLLSIEEMHSTSKMGVLYKNIVFELADPPLVVNIDNLLIEPNLSISKPAKIFIGKGFVKSGETEIFIEDLNADIILDSIKTSELSLFGQIKEIEGEDKTLLSNIEFLFQGLTSVEKSLIAKAGELSINIIAPKGPLSMKFLAVGVKGTLNESLSLSVKAKESKLDMSALGNGNPGRILHSENVSLDIDFLQKESWSMPIKLSADDLSSPVGHLGSSLAVQATGLWSNSFEDCDLFEVISGNSKCGTMTDVVNISLDFQSGNGNLSFTGQGLCVTPNANCPQAIESSIKTKSTAEILSKVILSGVLDPIVGGVILGALLSTPVSDNTQYDHQASIKVQGNRIFLNGKPII